MSIKFGRRLTGDAGRFDAGPQVVINPCFMRHVAAQEFKEILG